MLEVKHGTSTERAATHKACVWFIIKQQGFDLLVHPQIIFAFTLTSMDNRLSILTLFSGDHFIWESE